MKVPFYFRNKEQYEQAEKLVADLNESIRKKLGWDSASWINLHTKYTKSNPVYHNIPKRKVTDKKYLAILHTNKEKIERVGINLERVLVGAGFELHKVVDEPKYTGETTKKKVILTSSDEFNAIVSVMNAGFGKGNWQARCPRGTKKMLKHVQDIKNGNERFWTPIPDKYRNGIPVVIEVNQPDADINKYLFKAKLKA